MESGQVHEENGMASDAGCNARAALAEEYTEFIEEDGGKLRPSGRMSPKAV